VDVQSKMGGQVGGKRQKMFVDRLGFHVPSGEASVIGNGAPSNRREYKHPY